MTADRDLQDFQPTEEKAVSGGNRLTAMQTSERMKALFGWAGFLPINSAELHMAWQISRKSSKEQPPSMGVVRYLRQIQHHQQSSRINTDDPMAAVRKLVANMEEYRNRAAFEAGALSGLLSDLQDELTDPTISLAEFINRRGIPLQFGPAQVARHQDLSLFMETGAKPDGFNPLAAAGEHKLSDTYTLSKPGTLQYDHIMELLAKSTTSESQGIVSDALDSARHRLAFWEEAATEAEMHDLGNTTQRRMIGGRAILHS